MDRRQSPSRAGFTLIEVLIAVSIVALLVALLLPAIKSAVRRAQEAQVTSELNNLATALASFKTTYGDYPPSRVVLCEAGFNSLTATQLSALIPLSPSGNDIDISPAQLVQRSRLYLRRFWPRVDFDNGSQPFNFNNNGSTTDVLVLNGSECLTFFLGGIPQSDGTGGLGLTGFTKLPINPFLPPNTANPTTTNRTVPNYEFNSARLVDLDGDGIPSYLDPLDTTPTNRRSYAYFCSYGTNSYDPNDVNGLGQQQDAAYTGTTNDPGDYEHEDSADNTTPYVERGYTVTFPASTGNNYVVSPGPNPYCTTSPVPTTGTVAWINPNGFQLLSSGEDRLWGLGGSYVQNSLGTLGVLPIAPNDTGIINSSGAQPTFDYFVNGIRNNRESDNLSNFSGGRLN
jgi:prepilin-type N-terminal cleavage/methylation domain-containing protein